MPTRFRGSTASGTVNSVIRIPGGALLAAGVFGADSGTMGLVAGLLGGSLAATSFATKATTRAAINTSPEPFTNWLASLFEDGLTVGTVWLAWHVDGHTHSERCQFAGDRAAVRGATVWNALAQLAHLLRS